MDNELLVKLMEVATPLIEFLDENFTPTTSVVVSSKNVALQDMLVGVVIEKEENTEVEKNA